MLGLDFDVDRASKRARHTMETMLDNTGGAVHPESGRGSMNDDEELATFFNQTLSMGLYPHDHDDDDARQDHAMRSSQERLAPPMDPHAYVVRVGSDQPHNGANAADLMVANERGAVIGAYVPSPYLSIEGAMERLVTSQESGSVNKFDEDIMNFLREQMRHLGVGTGASAELEAHEPTRDDVNNDDPIQRALADAEGGSLSRKRRHSQSTTQNCSDLQSAARRRVERLCEHGGDADSEYLLSQFGGMIKRSGICMEVLLTRLCPLCGFLDNTQDAIGDREFQFIEKFAYAGIGNMDDDTHAILLSTLWNRLIYLPMRRRNLKIMPLTYRMAKEHNTKPHRTSKRAELYRDVTQLRSYSNILLKAAIKENGMTGELQVNKDHITLARQLIETKWRLLGTRDRSDPFRDGQSSAADTAGLATNPLQALRRSQTHRNRH